MGTPWALRIVEGIVVGTSATVVWFIFTAMNEARIELTSARETLEIQLEVNQGLLDKTDDMEMQVMRLNNRIDRLNDVGPLFGPTLGSAPPSGTLEDMTMPTESSDPVEVPTNVSESSHVTNPDLEPLTLEGVFLPMENNRNLQDRINQQRLLNK